MKQTSASLVQSLARKNILALKPYSSARDEFQGNGEIFLDANENPFPSPFNRYPDPLQREVKKKLAAIKGVNPENIFLGNGSDEAIDLVIRAFCEPNRDAIVTTDPTYGMYAVCAGVNAVEVKKVRLTDDFDIDVAATLRTTDEKTKVIFLCSPNNPTGNLLTRQSVLEVITRFSGLVVIDEAYIDFTDSVSFLRELKTYPNLLVLQTFSKAWGLAGLRLGMCFASAEIISILNKIKYPYNINIQTQELALVALRSENNKNEWVAAILNERSKLSDGLKQIPIVEQVYHSDSNFLLVRVRDAPATYQQLVNLGIVVRDRSSVTLCKNCLRITVGTSSENKTLIEALQKL